MDKHAIAKVFEEIAACSELRGENPFKVRAFQNAARTIEAWPGDLAAADAAGDLAATKGIGPAILEVVRECLVTGRSGALDALREEVPPGLLEMLRISGMGASKVRAVRDALGVSSLAELEAAARDGRLAKLPRFGEKTAAKILKGVEFLRRTSALRLFHHARRRAEQLRDAVAAVAGVERCEVAGSVRRHCEVVRETTLAVATALTPGALAEALGRTGAVAALLSADEHTCVVRATDESTVDLICAPPAQFGAALAWATGSAEHLAQSAARAADQGFALTAAGLLRDGAPVDCADEHACYAHLGLAWIPPELREGSDEIARAAEGTLPRLLERGDLRGLLHCHTTYSDGTNSVAELAEAARALGYTYLGITDHSIAAAYAGGLDAAAVARQHEEIAAWNRASSDLRILKGIEADILADGRLDYGEEVLSRFDFVVGSVHSRFELDEAAMTARVLAAMDDPHLTILGHPTGRLLLSRDGYAIDLHAVLAGAASGGVAVEINADPQRFDLDWRYCREARDEGVVISIGTDAHSLAGLGNADFGVGIARKGWLGPTDILNTRDAEGFLAHAKARR